MTQITEKNALKSLGWLWQAYEAALLAYHATDKFRRDEYLKGLETVFKGAARELNFALVPLTQDKPDSGRASIPETETAQFEPHQAGGA